MPYELSDKTNMIIIWTTLSLIIGSNFFPYKYTDPIWPVAFVLLIAFYSIRAYMVYRQRARLMDNIGLLCSSCGYRPKSTDEIEIQVTLQTRTCQKCGYKLSISDDKFDRDELT